MNSLRPGPDWHTWIINEICCVIRERRNIQVMTVRGREDTPWSWDWVFCWWWELRPSADWVRQWGGVSGCYVAPSGHAGPAWTGLDWTGYKPITTDVSTATCLLCNKNWAAKKRWRFEGKTALVNKRKSIYKLCTANMIKNVRFLDIILGLMHV